MGEKKRNWKGGMVGGERKKDGQHMDKQQDKAVQKIINAADVCYSRQMLHAACAAMQCSYVYTYYLFSGEDDKNTFNFLLQPNQDTQASDHPWSMYTGHQSSRVKGTVECNLIYRYRLHLRNVEPKHRCHRHWH